MKKVLFFVSLLKIFIFSASVMRKLVISLYLIIFIFISSLILSAEENNSLPKAKYLSTISLAYDGYWLSYKEYEGSRVLDKDTGWMNGGFLEYRGDTDYLFFRINLSITGSNSAKYDGALQDGTPYSTTTREIFFQEEINSGYKALKFSSMILTPYLAFGYRDWIRGQNKGADYEEEYTWYYGGIGLNFIYKYNDWTFGLDGLFQYTINPEMTTNIGGRVDNATFKLKPKPGCHIEATVKYVFYKRNYREFFVFISPYYQRWNIGASDKVALTQNGAPTGYEAYEPRSDTDTYGFRAGAGVTF